MTDYLKYIDLFIDFGLVVLIFMVQLVTYPSFLFFKRDNLIKWHTIYTGRITIIVAPMMITQGLLALYSIMEEVTMYSAVTVLLVCAVWICTFTIFVPIHKKITQDSHSESDLKRLVSKNWIRVLLWTLLFFINLIFW